LPLPQRDARRERLVGQVHRLRDDHACAGLPLRIRDLGRARDRFAADGLPGDDVGEARLGAEGPVVEGGGAALDGGWGGGGGAVWRVRSERLNGERINQAKK
jgi:hypothetical protein